jgi:MFS family permease
MTEPAYDVPAEFRLRLRELAKDREFLAYVGARQTAELAYTIETVAVGWQVYGLRHQPFDLGLVGLALFVPQLLLAIPAGIIADRFDRRIVCILCSLGEMAAELAFLAVVLAGFRSLAANLGAVALIGVAHSIGTPATRAMLAGIVRSERFVRAQAMNTSIGEVVSIAGPALGGVLIAVGVPLAFGVAAALYGLGALAFSLLTPRRLEDAPAEPGAWLDGIRFIATHPVILGAISLDLFAVLFGGATALLPVYATHILMVGPIGFGLLRSAPGVGAGIVATFLARHPIHRRAGPLLMWCVAGFGIATIVFAVSKNFVLSLVALAAIGGFDVVSVVIRSSLVQLGTPDAMRGRVSAVENVFIGASNELGAFESGGIAALIGTVPSVALGGVATLVVIALWAVIFPSLRRYDRIDSRTA